MRHRKSFNHLGRTSSHRKAMLSNMATSLILHKRITTTVAKAKALRGYVEPLITKSKEDTTHSRRVVFSHLNDKQCKPKGFHTVQDFNFLHGVLENNFQNPDYPYIDQKQLK